MKINKRKKKAGFTLIELIIVIAILGILAAIAVPKYGGIQKDAKIRADQVSAKVIADTTNMLIAMGGITISSDTTINFTDPDKDEDEIVNEIKEYIQNTPKLQAIKDGEIYIWMKPDDTIAIMAGKDSADYELFPNLAEGYPDGSD